MKWYTPTWSSLLYTCMVSFFVYALEWRRFINKYFNFTIFTPKLSPLGVGVMKYKISCLLILQILHTKFMKMLTEEDHCLRNCKWNVQLVTEVKDHVLWRLKLIHISSIIVQWIVSVPGHMFNLIEMSVFLTNFMPLHDKFSLKRHVFGCFKISKKKNQRYETVEKNLTTNFYLELIWFLIINKRPEGLNSHLSFRDFTLTSCQRGSYLYINNPIIN